jgi:hypothetical protein
MRSELQWRNRQARHFEESIDDVESMSHEYRQFALICQLEAHERGKNDAKDAAAAIAGSTSSQRPIKKSFKVPHFFKQVLSKKMRGKLLCSSDMIDKLESGSSVSSCKVHEIVQALCEQAPG